MENNLVTIKPDIMTIMAKKVASSGMFGFKNENQAYALMLIAESEGLHPMKAIQQYHIINGRPALKSTEVLSRFQKDKGCIKWITTDEETAEAELSHPQGGSITIKWTIEKAKKAGIYDKNPTWKTYPSNMLRARVITDGVNALYPACLNGALTESQAQDIPSIEDIEDAEVTATIEDEVKPLSEKELKLSLSNKLRKLNFNDADIKDFATFYDLNNKMDLLSDMLEDEKFLLQQVELFENQNQN